MQPRHLVHERTADGLITWEGCLCELCQHPAVPYGSWLDDARHLVRWYVADSWCCSRCGRYHTTCYFECPRCRDEEDAAEEGWRERERPREEAQAFIERWLTRRWSCSS